jgi:hypothetical protein
MTGGHVCIKVNDQVGANFLTHNGLRQGDPLSPVLFNIVADMLAILINRAKEDGQFDGLIPHLVDGAYLFCSMRMILFFFWTMILPKHPT